MSKHISTKSSGYLDLLIHQVKPCYETSREIISMVISLLYLVMGEEVMSLMSVCSALINIGM